jgi:lambda repressor-like predicted transcriptional regulator
MDPVKLVIEYCPDTGTLMVPAGDRTYTFSLGTSGRVDFERCRRDDPASESGFAEVPCQWDAPPTLAGVLDLAAEEVDAQRRRMSAEEEALAENLARVMEEKGVTQARLADMTGLSQPAISMLLGRKYRPKRSTVRWLARALGVPPGDLWPGIGD